MSGTQTLLRLFGELCAAGMVLGVLYNLTAAILVLRFPRPTKPAQGYCPAVTVLKPLHGNEPGLFWRLASFCRQDYPGAVQLVCGTQSETDAAIDVVKLLAATHPSMQIDLKGGPVRSWHEPENFQPDQHAGDGAPRRAADFRQRYSC
jgi:ceramide glucosyltransferase